MPKEPTSEGFRQQNDVGFESETATKNKDYAERLEEIIAASGLPQTRQDDLRALKQPEQLRELVENLNEGHDDDFNDSMPLRKRSKRLEVLLCISPNVTLGLLTVLLPF